MQISVTTYKMTYNGTAYEIDVATKDTTILYLKPLTTDEWHFTITIDGEVIELYCHNTEGIAYDISDLLRTETNSNCTIKFERKSTGEIVSTTLYFRKIIGYHYAEFVRQLMKAPNKVNGYTLETSYNTSTGDFFALSAPLTMYAPFVDDGSEYPFASQENYIAIPMWSTAYGNQNVQAILNNNIISNAINNNGVVNLSFTNQTYGVLDWGMIGTHYLSTTLRRMRCTERYLRLKFKSPYGPFLTNINPATNQEGVFIFKVYEVNTDIDVQSFENDMRLFPYRTSRETRLVAGIENITAWDVAIYSQILLSEEVSILLGDGTAYEPAKIVKQKITSNVTNADKQDIKIELILNEK
jgi:hypothetical protein